MLICVPHVDISTNCIQEDFLEFVVAENLKLQQIEKLGLEKQYLVGQGYDGAYERGVQRCSKIYHR